MQKKLHIKKGDTVVVITGESKGQRGRVLEIFRKKQRALVEGVNIISKHTKPDAQNPQGGIVKKEAPVHISNLMLIDPSSGEPTRIGRKYNDNNKLVRYSIKSGEEIK
ncbi:MAG: 50S ribosomal protein L24 [Bacteroidales bacterium]|nr:50S ribosomal protein L24 [Bacteroidales bacterium]